MTPVLKTGVLPIPSELTEHTLTFCEPSGVAAFSQTCRRAHDLVYKTPYQHIWRELYLSRFDDPRNGIIPHRGERDIFKFHWKEVLQLRVWVEKLAYLHRSLEAPKFEMNKRCYYERGSPSNSSSADLDNYKAFTTFASVIDEVAPVDEWYVSKRSRDLEWVTRLLRDSHMLGVPLPRMPLSDQRVARLCAYIALGLALGNRDERSGWSETDLDDQRITSRWFVYNLENYTESRLWGPFQDANTIDWRHVMHILNVVAMNLRDLDRWDIYVGIRPPPLIKGLEALRAYSAPGSFNRSVRDWAGVEGHWRRYVCFLDYRDLTNFNFRTSPPRSRSFFSDPSVKEATRLFHSVVHVVSDEMESDEFSFPGHPPRWCCADGPDDLPPIHFNGYSKGGTGNEQRMKGCVKMLDGHIRWRWVTIHDSRILWSGEGVQLGGVCSAAGIIANWTGVRHAEVDPAGPLWAWKVATFSEDSSILDLEGVESN